jgi:hypothetical protein
MALLGKVAGVLVRRELSTYWNPAYAG